MKRLLIACLLGAAVGLGLVGVARAAIDTYEFKDEVERERFRSLTEELRCPKCQNQNIADSNAPIATDLRREIYRMLDDGRSDKEIVDFLVMRYGDFVMYKPPLDSRTWLLWYGLVFMALVLFKPEGIAGFWQAWRARREAARPQAAAPAMAVAGPRQEGA